MHLHSIVHLGPPHIPITFQSGYQDWSKFGMLPSKIEFQELNSPESGKLKTLSDWYAKTQYVRLRYTPQLWAQSI